MNFPISGSNPNPIHCCKCKLVITKTLTSLLLHMAKYIVWWCMHHITSTNMHVSASLERVISAFSTFHLSPGVFVPNTTQAYLQSCYKNSNSLFWKNYFSLSTEWYAGIGSLYNVKLTIDGSAGLMKTKTNRCPHSSKVDKIIPLIRILFSDSSSWWCQNALISGYSCRSVFSDTYLQ